MTTSPYDEVERIGAADELELTVQRREGARARATHDGRMGRERETATMRQCIWETNRLARRRGKDSAHHVYPA